MGFGRAILFGVGGALIGGPIGGLIGVVVGAQWEKILKKLEKEGEQGNRRFICPHCQKSVIVKGREGEILRCGNCGHLFLAKPVPGSKIEYGIGLLAKIVKADGIVSKQEAQEVGRIFREVFQLEEEGFEEGKRIFNRMKEAPFTIYQIGDLFYSATVEDPEFREGIYLLMFHLAAIEGGLEREEEKILKEILTNLHLDPFLFEEGYQVFVKGGGGEFFSGGGGNQQEEAFKILGIPKGSSWDEVKKAYRQKMKELHPDRYQNLPESARQAIEEEAKKVNWAYQFLKKNLFE
ncbi:MAG: DnaJ domain-containing protein [Campylobacterales bacterium]